jgi:hypothetical protein
LLNIKLYVKIIIGSDEMICLKCGCRVNNGVKFCPTCGTEMTGENVKQEEVVVNNQKEKKVVQNQ